MGMKVEIKDNAVYLNNLLVYLDKGGKYSELDEGFGEKMGYMANWSRQQAQEIYDYFETEFNAYKEEEAKIQQILDEIRTDFLGLNVSDVIKALSVTPADLRDKVALSCEDQADDDGFRRSYWTLASDVNQYPYFSAMALSIKIAESRSYSSYRIAAANRKLESNSKSLKAANAELAKLKDSFKECNDEEFVEKQLKSAKLKINKLEKEVEDNKLEKESLDIDVSKIIDSLKESNSLFHAALTKILTYKNQSK